MRIVNYFGIQLIELPGYVYKNEYFEMTLH